MVEVINIKKERVQSVRRLVLHIVLISLFFLAVVAVSIFLLVTSKLDYLPQLIINIVLWALLIILLLFYFLNIFPLDKYYFSFYKGANSTTLEHHRSLTFLKEIESKDIYKTTHRVLQFSYKEGEKDYAENLYVLDSDINFETSKRYKIDTYHNIIIKYEAL